MPYDQTKKKFMGVVDDEIPVGQQRRISQFRKILVKRSTKAEIYYREVIADAIFLRSEGHIRFQEQKDFIIAKGFTFIVDFYFPKFKLAVEVDGAGHYTEVGKAKDQWRSRLLQEHFGVVTIHFENKYVLSKPEAVWDTTVEALMRSPKATPYLQRKLKQNFAAGFWEYWQTPPLSP